MPDEKIDQKRPAHAENELKKMQQRLVDDTVDDSFPASDPPAWTTSGQKSVAAKCDPDDAAESKAADQSGSQGIREGVQRVAEGATRLAEDAYRTGERYLEEGRRRFPEADRYVRQGREAVRGRVHESPFAAMLLAGVVGYVFALLIHGRSGSRPQERRVVPPYGRRPPLNEAQRHGMQAAPGAHAGPFGDRAQAASATSDSF